MGRASRDHSAAQRGANAPKQVRRTQLERSAETRARVIRGATECVAELGFGGATMTAIAKRAGVTWGAIQHQFGDKDTILDAVLEASLGELEAELCRIAETSDASVQSRVKAFVRLAGNLLEGPGYRAFVEIQLGRSRKRERLSKSVMGWSERVAEVLEGSWRSAFGDLGLPAKSVRSAGRFGFMVLSGIAAESMLFPDVDFSEQHLRVLQETLMRLLQGG